MSDLSTWPGLITNADPHEIPPGAATEQTNFVCEQPGKLQVRRGLQPITFDTSTGASAQVLSMYGWRPFTKQYAVFLTSDGKVYSGNRASGNPIEGSVELVSIERSSCWAQDRWGRLFRFNGVERGTVFNGGAVYPVGITAPAAAPTVTPDGSGAITGSYACAYRYIDADGKVSSLSPAATAVASSDAHFDWSDIVVSTEARVGTAGIQLFRSLAGEPDVLYLVTTLNNTGTPAYEDALADATLEGKTELPIFNTDGSIYARSFDKPREDYEVAVPYQDRLFMAVPNASLLSDYVTNVASWNTKIINRYLYRDAAAPVIITAAVASPAAVTIGGVSTLVSNLTGARVSCEPDSRNLLLYSEPDEFEYFSQTKNTIGVQDSTDDNDNITGLMPHGGSLWILKDRHVYRAHYVRQPNIDMQPALAYSRGCVNQQCWDFLEDTAYMVDCYGIWRMGDTGFEALSGPISDYWSDGTILWTNKKWFFTACDPQTRTVRFYCQFTGDTETRPTRAICYNETTGAWWLERYYFEVSGKARIETGGDMRLLVGSPAGKVLIVGEGTSDIVTTAVSGTATSATGTTLVDTATTFVAGQVGAPLTITGGTGKGQVRIITAVGGAGDHALTVATWTTNPDDTSTYTVGGIKATYKSGLFEIPTGEVKGGDGEDGGGQRALTATYQPTTAEASILAQLYWDHETSAETLKDWNKDFNVTTVKGSTDATINLKRAISSLASAPGYARLPFTVIADKGTLTHRFMSVGLEAYQGAERISLYAMELEAVK